jgi:sugar/nucleoside kinase (ribokinase family)
MPFGVQRSLLRTLRRMPAPFVSVDPHLEITEETLSEWRDVLADADAFFPGEDELLLEDAQASPERVLPRLVNGRLRFVVFKRGGKGGILYDAHQARFHTWVAHTDSVVDQTGAGDAFAAGFVCAYLEGLSVEACVQRAVVTASVAVEGWGTDALFSTRREDAEARLQRWYGGNEARTVGEER